MSAKAAAPQEICLRKVTPSIWNSNKKYPQGHLHYRKGCFAVAYFRAVRSSRHSRATLNLPNPRLLSSSFNTISADSEGIWSMRRMRASPSIERTGSLASRHWSRIVLRRTRCLVCCRWRNMIEASVVAKSRYDCIREDVLGVNSCCRAYRKYRNRGIGRRICNGKWAMVGDLDIEVSSGSEFSRLNSCNAIVRRLWCRHSECDAFSS